MPETPWGRPKEFLAAAAPRSKSRARWPGRLFGIVYLLVLTGAVTGLCGSLLRQLYRPLAHADTQKPAKRMTWCRGQLMALKVELEEAVVQEMARSRITADLTRSERARRRTWSQRLGEVRARCEATASDAGRDLAELASRLDGLIDELSATRMTLVPALEGELASKHTQLTGSAPKAEEP